MNSIEQSLLYSIYTLTDPDLDWLKNLNEHFSVIIGDLKKVLLETLSLFSENMPSINIAEQINVVLATCKKMIDRILPILSAMKSRLHEFTDGGPGVGV